MKGRVGSQSRTGSGSNQGDRMTAGAKIHGAERGIGGPDWVRGTETKMQAPLGEG